MGDDVTCVAMVALARWEQDLLVRSTVGLKAAIAVEDGAAFSSRSVPLLRFCGAVNSSIAVDGEERASGRGRAWERLNTKAA